MLCNLDTKRIFTANYDGVYRLIVACFVAPPLPVFSSAPLYLAVRAVHINFTCRVAMSYLCALCVSHKTISFTQSPWPVTNLAIRLIFRTFTADPANVCREVNASPQRSRARSSAIGPCRKHHTNASPAVSVWQTHRRVFLVYYTRFSLAFILLCACPEICSTVFDSTVTSQCYLQKDARRSWQREHSWRHVAAAVVATVYQSHC